MTSRPHVARPCSRRAKTRRAGLVGCAAALLLTGLGRITAAQGGEPTSPTRVFELSAPTAGPVDFERDIRPILERSCLRCHGPERPRSGLRLDTREGILAGGDGGPVVVLSNSAASRLIHAVARSPEISEDLWMPPEGRTPPLSAEEIGLLRAWIDQGLPWTSGPPRPADRIEVTVGTGWRGGSGPASLLRSAWQRPSGWDGGLENLFWSHQPPEGPRFTLHARALRDDAFLQMDGWLPEWGRASLGVSQYRWYGPDRGQWPLLPSGEVGLLDREPALDIGRARVTLELDRRNWPGLRLGYEHRYRDGSRAITSWSAPPDGTPKRLLWPAYEVVDEESHILRFHAHHEVADWRFEEDLRLQWTERHTSRTNALFNPPEGDARFLTRVTETHQSFQAANAVRFDRAFRPWLRATGGYLYSRYDADGSFALDEAPLNPAPGVVRRWRSPSVTLEHSAHVANANLVAGPWAGWTIVTGVQSEWTRHHGLGRASFDYELSPDEWFLQPTLQESARDRFVLTERLGLRGEPIPRSVVFAEAAAQQDKVELFEEQPGGDTPFRRDTLAEGRAWDLRAGFDTTPLPNFTLSASCRWRLRDTDFDHRQDVVPTEFGDFPNSGYPAFIRDRHHRTEQIEARLTWRPAPQWRAALLYRFLSSRSETATDPLDGFDPATFEPVPGFYTPGTRTLGAESDVHAWTLQLSWRPVTRWSFRLQGSLQDQRIRSAVDDAATLPAWAGRSYRLQGLARWTWNDRTEAEFSYEWAMSDFHRDTLETVLPIGVLWREQYVSLAVRRRCGERLTVGLRYGLWKYDEPTSGGANDVLANLAWVNLTWRWQ